MPTKQELKNQALAAISAYLEANGWKATGTAGSDHAWFQRIDPVSGQSHRTDMAFFIQSERDIYKKPCITGDTKILTPKGLKPVKSLKREDKVAVCKPSGVRYASVKDLIAKKPIKKTKTKK